MIGTPGRLQDLEKRGVINMKNFKNIVLDEVDRMFDMGFVDEIKELLTRLPEERQSLFFSATIPRSIEVLISEFLKNPIRISVKTVETAENVDQDIVRVIDRNKKIEQLHELLINPEFKKVLIFGETKKGVEDLTNELYDRGFKIESIHGDKRQNKREKALRLFKQNYINILVAIDVAARGLDIFDVTHVINYDIPKLMKIMFTELEELDEETKKGLL